MSRHDTIGKHKTTVRTKLGVTTVRYHSTDVVQFDNALIHLDTGGWKSNTTKLRMNQTANQFGLNFQVYQHKFEWFVVRRLLNDYASGYDWSNPQKFDDDTLTLPRFAPELTASTYI